MSGTARSLRSTRQRPIARHLRLGLLGLLVIVAIGLLAGCGGSSSERVFSIGLVTNNPNGLRNITGFTEALGELGYVEGDNVTYLFADGVSVGPDLDDELERFVDASVDLIFTAGTPTGVAAKRVTAGTDIPVVFGVIADPVAAGVLDDLSRPGGNMTGVKLGQDQVRRLELLLEIAPGVEKVLVPFNPDDTAATSAVAQITEAASQIGVDLILEQARTDDEVTNVLADIPDGVDAVFLVPDSTVNARLADILAVARRLELPTSGPSTAQVEEGALTTYGFIHERAGAQAARIADRVLRGARPGDLPVEEAESFLGINLVTADEIGLEISDAVLQQAEIILRPTPE